METEVAIEAIEREGKKSPPRWGRASACRKSLPRGRLQSVEKVCQEADFFM